MDEADYKKQLTDYIAERISITEKDKELIADAYNLVTIKKKAFLFHPGQVCSIEAFVVEGTFRIFYVDQKGLEHVLYFAFIDWWAGNSGQPSYLHCQALEDSKVLVIDSEKKEKLLSQVPRLERLFRIILQKHLIVLQKRFLLTISANAAERYEELIKRSPGIEQLVPQHQIASYLGILPESLSRMKKQLLK